MKIMQLAAEDWKGCFERIRPDSAETLTQWFVSERQGRSDFAAIASIAFDTRRARLHLRLADGTQDTVATGEVWVRELAGDTDQILVISPESSEAVLHLVRQVDATPAGAVSFGSLTQAAAEELLTRNNVGRIAYVKDGEPRLLPVHYVFRTRSIYGRTSPDTELGRTVREGDPVAFEVDEVDDLFNWRSVIVRGRILLLPPESGAHQSERGRALGILRTLIQATFGDTDPTPGRTHIFRIPIEEISGRTASM